MITIDSLSVKYKTTHGDLTALNNISLEIQPGGIYAVIGPSGCGKTTLLHILSGVIRNYEGKVSIHGEPVNPKVQKIGLIPQNFGLLPWKTVYENAVLGLKVKGENISTYHDHIEHIFEQLGIYRLKARYPGQLSGGEKQRVAIARSFILRPDILLMDEPFSALDAITRKEVQRLFMSTWQQNPTSAVLVTHSIEEAVYLGKKIVLLSPSPGQIIKIFDNPFFNKGENSGSQIYAYTAEIENFAEGVWTRCHQNTSI